MKSILFILALVLGVTGCAEGTGRSSMGPGSHKLTSADEGTWRAPGSKSCRWTLTYKTRHNAPAKKKSGSGFAPVVTIGALGVRFTSDNCGTFTK